MKKNIHCIDQSSGRLFYASNFLFQLEKLDTQVILALPDNWEAIYGQFFNSFDKLKLTSLEHPINDNNILVIFSDINNLNLPRNAKNQLIFPIIKNEELEKFRQISTSQVESQQKKIIPLSNGKIENEIISPNPVWAIDILLRELNIQPLKGYNIRLNAGPTVEDIDPIRFLSNRSSGKMGIALARAAFIMGANIQLVLGPTHIDVPPYINLLKVRSAKQMAQTVLQDFNKCDVYIGSAAVADFTPAHYQENKIKKKDGILKLILKQTVDILNEIKQIRKKQIIIGFSLETTNEIENSFSKLKSKDLDMIVVNNPLEKGAAFAEDTNLVTLISKDGTVEKLPLMSKFEVANKIMEKVGHLIKNREDAKDN